MAKKKKKNLTKLSYKNNQGFRLKHITSKLEMSYDVFMETIQTGEVKISYGLLN